MEYPHARYITYLISRRMERYEIMSECAAYQLVPPNDVDLTGMYQEVGFFPNTWIPTLKGAPQEHRKWLQDLGVYEMWEQGRDVTEAFGFLNQGKMRQAFESLMLLHGDVEISRQEMVNTFTTRRVPSQEVLELYCYFFWDVPSMSKPGLFDFLKAQQNTEFKLAALDGDADYTYAVLGLKQTPDIIENLDWFLQFAKLETMTLLRQGGAGSGQRAAGQAALMRATLDVMAMRMELGQTTAGSDIRKEAMLFKARIVPRKPREIPSIDDLRETERGDVIDAEYADADDESSDEDRESNVHRLTPRRGPGKSST